MRCDEFLENRYGIEVSDHVDVHIGSKDILGSRVVGILHHVQIFEQYGDGGRVANGEVDAILVSVLGSIS